MTGYRPPGELFLGTEEGTWPVQAFTAPGHAVSWLQEKNGPLTRRHIWKVRVEVLAEMTLTPPVAAQLVEKEPGTA
jgi:hypothetical protein